MAGKKDKKGKAKKKSPDDAPSVNEILLRKLLKLYDQYSNEVNVKCCPDVVKAINQALEDNVELKKIVFRPIDKDPKLEEKFSKALQLAQESGDTNAIKELKATYVNKPPPVSLEQFMRSINEIQLQTCKELFIVDLPLTYMDIVQLTQFIKLASNPIKKLEICDCLLQPDFISRFSPYLNSKRMLTTITLDYNEFGDKGCIELCRGLTNNVSVLSLSLCYCNLTYKSGTILGEILSTTALKDLFLDGNDLRCQGVMDLLKVVSEECENEALKKEVEEREKIENEIKRLTQESKPAWEKQEATVGESQPENTENEGANEDKDKKDGKKKKKKKKKKKASDEPPKVGPFVCKLHLADNAIDMYEDGSDQMKSLKILHQTIEMIVKLIKYSPDVEEINLWNNSIGNISAKMLLNALEYRKLKKVGSMGLSVTEKIEKELFDAILKAGKKVKKKKKKK